MTKYNKNQNKVELQMRHWICKFKVPLWHKRILKFGYTFRFVNKRPISTCMNSDSLKGCSNIPALLASVNNLLATGIIKETECNQKEFCNRLFLVSKPNGDFRPILNVKRFNHYIVKEKFKMERVADAILLIEPGDHMITIDLTDAYLAIPIASSMYKFCVFKIGTQHYHFTRLCFGLTSAPYVFTKFMKVSLNVFKFKQIKIKFTQNLRISNKEIYKGCFSALPKPRYYRTQYP